RPDAHKARAEGFLGAHDFRVTNGSVDVNPPSTGKACPLTYEASSDAKNSAIAAISSGCPYRAVGLSCPILPSFPRARAPSKIGFVLPVSINPGQIAFTRTPVP